jgi:carbonic anhydrase
MNLLQWAENHDLFKKVYFKSNEEQFVRLVEEGQSPKALFIGCSDSRIVPDLLLGTKPGDLFVVRTAGNFVPPFNPSIEWDGVAATIVFAVEVLGIKDVIVCGHSHCGAINGLYNLDRIGKFDYLPGWIKFGMKAKEIVEENIPDLSNVDERDDVTGRLSVLLQLDNLLTYPFISSKVDNGTLHLHGWFFSIEKGMIEYYDPVENRYISLDKWAKKQGNEK